MTTIPPGPFRCAAHHADTGPYPLDCPPCRRSFDTWQRTFCTPGWRIRLRRVRATIGGAA
jgi:hypothetical protein